VSLTGQKKRYVVHSTIFKYAFFRGEALYGLVYIPADNCAAKFDEKTGELKDETTRGLLKQQLASFATFIARVAAKS